MEWELAKNAAVNALMLSRDQLHILGGLLLFMGALAALRSGVVNPLAWLLVFAFELLNEALDLLTEAGHGGALDWLESLRDIATTMTLPTAIMASLLMLRVLTPVRRVAAPRRRLRAPVDLAAG